MYSRSIFPAVIFILLRHLVVAFTPLSDNTLHSPLLRPTDGDFNIDTGSILSPILIPRVPGTEGSLKVLNHLQDFFRTNLPAWQLSTQNSTSETPTSGGKKLPFVNFMATRDPPWATTGETGRLLLVAHYDSKLTPEGFIGATDSAVPVAVMLHVARAIDAALTKKWEAMARSKDPLELDEEQGITLLFLDGEEAFLSWTDTDSLYGARSLAEEWESAFHPAMSSRRNRLSDIQLFVLLDLLGAKDPKLQSFFPTTHWAYKRFSETEARLRASGTFKSKGDMWFYEGQKDSDANARWSGGGVQDDHIPFLMRGVEVLHLIPTPFPRVWHTSDDDGPHLHMDTCVDWGTLVAAWTAEYMELEGYMGDGQVQKRETRTRTEL